MSNIINIKQYDIVTTKQISGFKTKVNSMELFVSANLIIELFDSSGNLQDVRFLTIDGSDYQAWGLDDNYINTWVASKLGFTLI
jgi:hypothetical protein